MYSTPGWERLGGFEMGGSMRFWGILVSGYLVSSLAWGLCSNEILEKQLERAFPSGSGVTVSWEPDGKALLTFAGDLPKEEVSSVTRAALKAIEARLQLLPLSTDHRKKILFNIHFCLEEAALNAVEWGNRRRPGTHVRIRLHFVSGPSEGAGVLYASVQDEGEGFDPANLPHALSEDDPLAHEEVREQLGLRAGGRGLAGMKHFATSKFWEQSTKTMHFIWEIH